MTREHAAKYLLGVQADGVGRRGKAAIRVIAISGLLLALGGPAATVAAQTKLTFTLEHSRLLNPAEREAGGRFIPHWSGGAVLSVVGNPSDEPLIYRTGRDGRQEIIRFSIPDGRHISIYGLAGADDGTVAAVGSAYSKDGKGTAFLARIAPDRQKQTVTQLMPYMPNVVTIAGDGSIWMIGWVRAGESVAEENVLKRFDATGRALASEVLQARHRIMSGDDEARPRNRDATALSALRNSRDRVAWYTNGNEYIEFSLDGKILTRLDGPPVEKPLRIGVLLALSAQNDVVAGNDRSGYWSLDRGSRTWIPIQFTGGERTKHNELLLGFDENCLVFISGKGEVRRYRRE